MPVSMDAPFVVSTTPGTPGKIVEALNPASCTLILVLLREKPRRTSVKNDADHVWTSSTERFWLRGTFVLAPVVGKAPDDKVFPEKII